jgi:hypothetical protein
MSTPWPWIEGEVLHRLNDIKADDAALIIASYETVPRTANEADDVGFALTAVRVGIVDTVMEMIGNICRTDGDPRRLLYKLTATVAHGGDLPSSMGPYGAIFDALTGRSLEDRSAQEIADMRDNVNFVYGNPPPTFFYKAQDGQKIYHTLPGNASVEYFDFPRPVTTYTALNTLFGSMANFAPIPDEFGVVAADGAAGRIAGKAASLISEAANFMQLYYRGQKDRGLNVRMIPDFPPKPAG